MKKVCLSCKIEKEKIYFSKSKSNKDKLQKYCKECYKKYNKYHIDDKVKNRTKKYSSNRTLFLKARNYAFINRYLRMFGKCTDCGIKNIRVLEFDHITSKIEGVKRLADQTSSIKKIKSEIRKCEIRCCNCHRIKTQNQLDWGFFDLYNWIDTKRYQGFSSKKNLII